MGIEILFVMSGLRERALTSPSEPRQDERAACRPFLSAMVRDGRATYVVRVRNISLHGATIEGRTLPPFGADIYRDRETVAIPAKVSWACAGKCGLHFEKAIDPRDWKVSLQSVEEAWQT